MSAAFQGYGLTELLSRWLTGPARPTRWLPILRNSRYLIATKKHKKHEMHAHFSYLIFVLLRGSDGSERASSLNRGSLQRQSNRESTRKVRSEAARSSRPLDSH